MSANPYQAFGLSCPNGADFHICENTKREFIGCCTVDPCSDGSGLCERANLRAASFSESSYLDIPPQSCDSTGGDNHFYTCTANDPPFIGCCTLNPCVNMTCPSANLRAAVLSSDHDDRASFLSPSSSSKDDKSTSPAKAASNGLSSAGIAGIVIGVLAIVILVVGFALWRRREWPFKSAKPQNTDASSTRSAREGLMESPKTPWTAHTNSPAFNTVSPMSDPRSAVSQHKSGGHNNSNSPWHMPPHTPPPPPFFHTHHDNSRPWPFQNSYDTYCSPPHNFANQHSWPGGQSVHELLAEVQEANPELPAEERVQELRASCVVQPLRPPPSLKSARSPGVPDSPTLGPGVKAHSANRMAPAAKDGRPADSSPIGGSSFTAPKPRHGPVGLREKKQPEPPFDGTNVI